MTCLSCVMAWAATVQVGDFTALKNAIDNASNGDVIELTADITYDGAWSTVSTADLNSATTVVDALCITKSITLDGKGHKIIGWGKHDIGIGSVDGKFHGLKSATTASSAISEKSFGDVNTIHRVSLAIHPADANAAIDVVVKNLSLGNKTKNNRYFGIIAFDGVDELTLDNVTIETASNYGSQQGICFTGAETTPIRLTMSNSYINVGNSAYATYFLKPLTGTISNTTIDGWCALYFKNRNIPVYGAVVGTRGSNVTCDACTFICKNVHNGKTNEFAMFPIEDDGITLTLNNCSMNPEKIGNQAQSLVSLQAQTRTSGYQPVVVNINGDNTHIYSIGLEEAIKSEFAKGVDAYRDVVTGDAGGNGVAANVPLTINITGGTFTVNPADIAYPKYDGETWGGTTQGVTIDYTQYEIKEVSQGGNIVYRVVKKAAEKEPGVLYDLNDNVQSQGDGQNPTTSFDLSTGEEMTLNQATTKAGYVEVSDNGDDATIVKVGKTENPGTPSETKVDQTLVINNGLDVQGNSQVTVQAGSTLQIGKGGIVTEKPENIVIEADENGAASLIMDPAITVNQTPELTVKMTAKQIGRDSYGDYYWHRFAMPVQHIDTWTKEGALAPAVTYPTHLYGWSYDSNDWIKLAGGVSEMVAFKGYTLTLASEEISGHENELLDVTYVFKGNLAGNTNNALQFSHEGYNFFGNSYTGYISIAKLVEQITNDSKIQGTVWVWVGQGYEDISLNILAENPGFYDDELEEIAPMHTFVLKQNGTENANTTINYADAIWGNPRYGHDPAPAPRRRTNSENDAMMRVVVTAANGQKDAVRFVEGANYSDAFENGYDASKFMNAKSINVFATVNGEEFGTVATDNLSGKTITINTNSELAYTISFTNVNNEDYALRDNVTGQVINIEEGATYEFAAQPNSTVEGRFEIVNRANMPTAIKNTEVKANVKGIYTIMGQYLGENFDILPAGVYVVDGVKIVK